MVQNNSIWTGKNGYLIACPKCKKLYVKWAVPKIRRYMREHPEIGLRTVAREWGIPRNTLRRALR